MFLYCECRVCHYSVVVRASDVGDDKVACPICWSEDDRHPIAMTMRSALDSDVPKDLDVRKHPEGGSMFTCAGCGRQCMSRWSEAEALAEFHAIYGRSATPGADPAICDDCHTKLVVKGHA